VRFRIGGVLLCTALATTGCGSRMERADVARAERAGLVAQARALPTAEGVTAASAATSPDRSVTTPAGVPAAVPSSAPAPIAATPGVPNPAMAANAAPGANARVADTSAARRSAPVATSSSPGSSASAAAPVARRAPVTIGSVGTLSGPVGAFVKDSVFTVGVWVKWANSRGGLNGHPVRHIIADDGGDPSRYNALVRQMVEEQGVIAFLFNSIGFAGGDLSYVNSKRIPIIGHEGGSDLGYESPMVFTPWPAGTPYGYGLLGSLAEVAVPAGKTKLASLACSDVKLCDIFDKMWTGPAAKELGFEVVYRARPSLTQPDFTAECISARQAGAQAVMLALDNNSVLRVARSCARQGFKPLFGMADGLALPSIAADPIMDGTVVGTKVAPWPARDIPGLAELHQAFETVAPGVEPTGAAGPAWVAAKLFEAAGRNLPERPTAADVLDGLWAVSGETVGGMTYPLSFQRDQTSPRRSCWGVVTVHGGKFEASQGSRVKCR
jgi:ABC-type branched-subunit amino acid transport system substrate-binding protein